MLKLYALRSTRQEIMFFSRLYSSGKTSPVGSILFAKQFSILNKSIVSRRIATKEEILATSLKKPLTQSTPNSTSNNSNKDKDSKKNNFYETLSYYKDLYGKFIGIFIGGTITYYAIDYILDKTRKPKSNVINLASKNLPGKVTPSKRVTHFVFAYNC